ncbi:Myotubularin-related protein 13 [Clarias magur]|uniref:Myotubularin-related protein 13 n=1 Tax=Clarias magur TaxID=1594786 RepID=A0A8J4X810_CLAMG|nr:Myotubularin-related protein 13 [Clarias magur]
MPEKLKRCRLETRQLIDKNVPPGFVHSSVLLVKLKSENKCPVEWTARASPPPGSTGVFISYLFKPTELDAVNPSDAIQLKPQTQSLLLLRATLGSISVG